jgi:branched-chain amino acid transport system ATP-binding protein
MSIDGRAGRLETRDLHVYFGRAHILQGVDLTLESEPLAVLGRNGMGKTTLCQAIVGLLPASGQITFDGHELLGRPPHEIASAGIGYVPQGRRIFPSLTVHEHLRLVRPVGSGAGRRWTPDEIYGLFPELAQRRRYRAGELSGGEQQMLAISRALLTQPRLLVMDEPSEGLAPIVIEHLKETLRGITAAGVGLLLVEQNLGVAAAVAGSLAVMVSGRIVYRTGPSELVADEDAQRRYLGLSPLGEPRAEDGGEQAIEY